MMPLQPCRSGSLTMRRRGWRHLTHRAWITKAFLRPRYYIVLRKRPPDSAPTPECPDVFNCRTLMHRPLDALVQVTKHGELQYFLDMPTTLENCEHNLYISNNSLFSLSWPCW